MNVHLPYAPIDGAAIARVDLPVPTGRQRVEIALGRVQKGAVKGLDDMPHGDLGRDVRDEPGRSPGPVTSDAVLVQAAERHETPSTDSRARSRPRESQPVTVVDQGEAEPLTLSAPSSRIGDTQGRPT